MFLQPGKSEDHVLISEFSDSKGSAFRVIVILESDIRYFGDGASLVGGAVDVVHRDWEMKLMGRYPESSDVVLI